jgi:hypothetical protein
MEKTEYKILKVSGSTYNLPIFLGQGIKDLGQMIGFDGEISQIEQKCNFTYSGSTNNIKIYNTTNTTKYPTLFDAVFSINWGDGTTGTISTSNINEHNGVALKMASHTYSSSGIYTITLTLNSPWIVSKVQKTVKVPFVQSLGYPTNLGTLTFTVPYSSPAVTKTQDYLLDYRTTTGATNNTTIQFLGLGKSRIDEKELYGSDNGYSGVTTTSEYKEYQIDGLTYRDYNDGYTYISGVTSGSTQTFFTDEVYNGMVTRNEHFLGFIDEPQIFSDIFVDRGKQGVMEKNFRLTEIDNTGELDVYGNGYFIVRKQ